MTPETRAQTDAAEQQAETVGVDVPEQPQAAAAATDLPTPSLRQVFRDQGKSMWASLVLAVAGLWVIGLLGQWTLAGCFAFGVLLGYGNQLATELWLLKVIRSGHNPTKGEMTRSALVRLLVLTVLAVACVVIFWPGGVGAFIGLALTRLVLVVMTAGPILKELKRQ